MMMALELVAPWARYCRVLQQQLESQQFSDAVQYAGAMRVSSTGIGSCCCNTSTVSGPRRPKF